MRDSIDYSGIIRGGQGHVRGFVEPGQFMVAASDPRFVGLCIRPSMGRPREAFYGVSLYRHLSHYGYNNKTFRIAAGSPRVGQKVGDALAAMLGAHPIRDSFEIMVNQQLVQEGYVVREDDIINVTYAYPLTYDEYATISGESSFVAYMPDLQLTCGLTGTIRTTHFVPSSSYVPGDPVRLASKGRIRPRTSRQGTLVERIRIMEPPVGNEIEVKLL